MDEKGILGLALTLHPGAVRTDLMRNVSPFFQIMNILFYPLKLILFKTAWEGAQTHLYLILEDKNKLIKGGYYSDCKLSESSPFTQCP